MTQNIFFENLKIHTRNIIKQATTKNLPTIVLGLSGGPDSVFLLYLLHALKHENHINIIAAHLDHGWRAESPNDAEFCKQLCQKLDITFVSEHASKLDLQIKFNGSQEEVGRNLRRKFFQNILATEHADMIALAHHLQDQEETFFIRILRGTTLNGLSCMDAVNAFYIRPLLQTTKNDIVNFLLANKIEFLQDPTNASDKYLRNRIRNYVVPALQKCDARFDAKFQTMLESIKQEDAFLNDLSASSFNEIFHNNSQNKLVGNLEKFKETHKVLQRRIIVLWLVTEQIKFHVSTALIEEILRFLKQPEGGQHQINSTTLIFKKQKLFWIVVTNTKS